MPVKLPLTPSSSTLGDWLRWATDTLVDRSETARLDAEVLLAHALQVGRTHLYMHPERQLTGSEVDRVREYIGRRAAGMPVAYLTGVQEFWSLPLRVTPATLIPRPETELLVELALERTAPTHARILDLGTGSGAIALAIASERPRATVVAVDFSADALAVARDNRDQLGVGNVEFVQGDWYAPVDDQRFDIIVANPPYIRPDEPEPHLGDSRFEPHTALIAEEQGLSDVHRIISSAPDHLNEGGWLLVEHGYRQATDVRRLMRTHGLVQVDSARDLAGHERASFGRYLTVATEQSAGERHER